MRRFLWSILTRFAKTFGCIFFLAGLVAAVVLYRQKYPLLEHLRYRTSLALSQQLSALDRVYLHTQQLVMNFKGKEAFPPEYAAASFTPHFEASYNSTEDFQELRSEISKLFAGKETMKRFVIDRVELLLGDIRAKLIAHVQSLAPTPTPGLANPSPTPTPLPLPYFGDLYLPSIGNSEIVSRQTELNAAKEFLRVLESSAENPENKKTLEDSIAEVDKLAKLLPAPPAPAPQVEAPVPREPLGAEKMAARISQILSSVRSAVLSSWSLDEAYEHAAQMAAAEESNARTSAYMVKQLSDELNLTMAGAITAGVLLGTYFLLIGDWTAKSSTKVLDYRRDLIENFSASPKEVYDAVENSIRERKIPRLESSRVFWHEGGALSSKREYLRLARERLVFEICAAPFGTGFFYSFRLAEIPLTIDPLAIFLVLGVSLIALLVLASVFGLIWGGIILVLTGVVLLFLMRTAIARGLGDVDRVLMKTPLVAPLYEMYLRPLTYYRDDSSEMYRKAVENAVTEAFQKIFGNNTIMLIGRAEPPIMDKIYRK